MFQVADDDWVVAIGDVEGKGIEAATVTALARHVLRAASVRNDSPRDAVLTLNEVLVRAETKRLLTAVVLRLRRSGHGWSAKVAAAGHAAPIVASRTVPAHDLGPTGTILGVLANPPICETTTSFAPGDVVLLTTDGVAEAWSPATKDFYGTARITTLVERLKHGPARPAGSRRPCWPTC